MWRRFKYTQRSQLQNKIFTTHLSPLFGLNMGISIQYNEFIPALICLKIIRNYYYICKVWWVILAYSKPELLNESPCIN